MSAAESSPKVADRNRQVSGRRVRGLVVLFTGRLALAAPFISGPLAFFLVGVSLICCGALEMVETFRAPITSQCAYNTRQASFCSYP
jgi:uncharacterized membrane protein HdeD (DUF308 family)